MFSLRLSVQPPKGIDKKEILLKLRAGQRRASASISLSWGIRNGGLEPGVPC